jgi:lysozyme family protein
MLNRRQLGLVAGSALLAGSASLLPFLAGGARARDIDGLSDREIEQLRQRAGSLGIARAGARSSEDATFDLYTRQREELLDLMDGAGEAAGRSLDAGERAATRQLETDAGAALARLNAIESQTPKQEADRLFNSRRLRESFKWSDGLAMSFRDRWQACQVTDARRGEITRVIERITGEARRSAYQRIEAEVGTPWYFVAVIHNLEGSLNMTRHLHNGDPLGARTVQVPAGRPKVWNPPNDWASSAIDALSRFRTDDWRRRGWTIESMLWGLERFNGLGYRNRGIPSPYLWSYTNQYTKGKYVADGSFDPEAVSRQCGAASVLKVMIETGRLPAPPSMFG